MASSKTYQCLPCRLKQAIQHQAPRRSFHNTPSAQGWRRRNFPSFKPSDLESPELRPYTEREKKLLALKYTPEQMKAIEAGEAAVDAADLAQARIRNDPMRIKYIDDFSQIRPMLDRELTEQEQKDVKRSQNERALAKASTGLEGLADTEPHLLRLCQQTGLSVQDIRSMRTKTLVRHRVANQTRMGKIQSQYFLTIAGDGKGMLGIGEGKAAENEDAARQSLMNAIRNMQPIARYEERTIYGNVQGKVGASVVQLSARPPGENHSCARRSGLQC